MERIFGWISSKLLFFLQLLALLERKYKLFGLCQLSKIVKTNCLALVGTLNPKRSAFWFGWRIDVGARLRQPPTFGFVTIIESEDSTFGYSGQLIHKIQLFGFSWYKIEKIQLQNFADKIKLMYPGLYGLPYVSYSENVENIAGLMPWVPDNLKINNMCE